MLSKRLKRPYLYLPGSFDYEEITAQLENFCQAMGYGKLEETISVEEEIAACERALEKAHEVIGDTAVAIDYLYHPRPLGLAKLLLTWFPGDTDLSGLHQSGRKRGVWVAEGACTGDSADCNDPGENACTPTKIG